MHALRLSVPALTVVVLAITPLAAEDKKHDTAKVAMIELNRKVVEHGTLEASGLNRVRCEVKATDRGAPKITWLVADGTRVKTGDLLVVLDDTLVKERARAKRIERNKVLVEVEDAHFLDPRWAVFFEKEAEYQDLLEQIKKCKIVAPATGTVIFAVPDQTRIGGGSYQSILAQGEPVGYRQRLMTIFNPSALLVSVQIRAEVIKYLKPGMRATVNNPGQRPLRAHVISVDEAAAPKDYPDVLCHQVYLQIDDTLGKLESENSRRGRPRLDDLQISDSAKLKLGDRVTCTIFTRMPSRRVLAVPIQAVLKLSKEGEKPWGVVDIPDGSEAVRLVELGASDGKMIEIKSGLKEGEVVISVSRARVRWLAN